MAVLAVVGCVGSGPGRPQKPPEQGKETQSASQARANASFLTLDSIPPGLSLVRARFRAPNAVDYVLAGYDRGRRGLRIVAILAEPAAAYKVITVSEGPGVPDSLAAKPNRYLAVDTTAVAGKVDLLVIPLVAGPPVNTDRYTWVPARGEFLIVTPG